MTLLNENHFISLELISLAVQIKNATTLEKNVYVSISLALKIVILDVICQIPASLTCDAPYLPPFAHFTVSEQSRK